MMMMMILIMIIIIIIVIMIVIAFKGAIRDFLQSPHCAANRLQHVGLHWSGLGAIVCKSRATHRAFITCNMSCYVPRGTKGQLSCWTGQSLNRIYFTFYYTGWSYPWLQSWSFSAALPCIIGSVISAWNRLARCQGTVFGWGSKCDQRLLSQCGSG